MELQLGYLYSSSTSWVVPTHSSNLFFFIDRDNGDMSTPGEFTCTASESFVFVTHANRKDYPVLLNNLLQGHRGNLTSHLQYVMTKDGPEDNVTHYATAKCEHSH